MPQTQLELFKDQVKGGAFVCKVFRARVGRIMQENAKHAGSNQQERKQEILALLLHPFSLCASELKAWQEQRGGSGATAVTAAAVPLRQLAQCNARPTFPQCTRGQESLAIGFRKYKKVDKGRFLLGKPYRN